VSQFLSYRDGANPRVRDQIISLWTPLNSIINKGITFFPYNKQCAV